MDYTRVVRDIGLVATGSKLHSGERGVRRRVYSIIENCVTFRVTFTGP
jgi:hypothetical protein